MQSDGSRQQQVLSSQLKQLQTEISEVQQTARAAAAQAAQDAQQAVAELDKHKQHTVQLETDLAAAVANINALQQQLSAAAAAAAAVAEASGSKQQDTERQLADALLQASQYRTQLQQVQEQLREQQEAFSIQAGVAAQKVGVLPSGLAADVEKDNATLCGAQSINLAVVALVPQPSLHPCK